MLLKTADDKSKRLALLEELQRSTLLSASQQKWLREELTRLRKGIQGEKDSAYYLDQYFRNGSNHVVLHDLRFVVDGDVAQIDHMVINRGFGIYLFETKNYSGDLAINEHGEFTAQYDDVRFGIPSPIEQSERHARILQRLLKQLGIGNRIGSEMSFFHVVLLHPKSIIKRPAPKTFDTTNVIKADQFPSWHKQFVDKEGTFGETLKLMANLRGLDTIQDWAKKLVRQHRPADLLALPDFMQPKPAQVAPVVRVPEIQPLPPASDQRKLTPSASPSVTKPSASIAAEPSCPRCGKAMVQRVAKRGAKSGNVFWGCSGFTAGCRGTREIENVGSPN
ncbi:nuclease-related domain-containing protein [Hydrogenophaga palleronii]|uniref:nuclease-related domain-containing protein n=1 Tax=Hydrogenophaga palleronii TaxID=65655 RepID=UPI00082569E0|nr:NERD domain-containing protein [Hydrogenophaga palleronii]